MKQFINAPDRSPLDPLVKMAFTHYQFEAIHPFADSNDRTGRIVNALYLEHQELLLQPVPICRRFGWPTGLSAVLSAGAIAKAGSEGGSFNEVRSFLYAKDIMNITGRKERAARKLLARIRKKYRKKKGEFISVFEFCEFTGLKREDIKDFLSL